MKTKQVPAIVMLIAGFFTCIVSIFQHIEVGQFLEILFVVLVSFYILGCVIKIILDHNFAETENQEASEETDEDAKDNEEDAETKTEDISRKKADEN
jgi:mannitol-specific phosphotransferase system IIBC component